MIAQDKLPAGILKTKQHFEVLDGLRGIAALSVVIFHFMEVAYTDYSQDFIGHGFLAVDFFFCLSGFVIAYAYDDRIGKMGVVEFFKSRLIRLHPLVILGSILGLFAFLFDPFGGHPEAYSTGRIVVIFLASIFMIPFPVVQDRAFNCFGFDAPAWSLFWEYIANIVFAVVLWRVGRRLLFILTIVAAMVLCVVCYRAGNLMGGWGKGNEWDGGASVAFSFLAGMLVYRSKWIIKNKLGFVGMAILLFLAFVSPFSKWNFISEPLIVIIYFPLVVALGAGAIPAERIRKFCVFLGMLSYPLYMTHYTFIWMFANYFAANKPGPGKLAIIISCCALLMIGFAWLVMVVYDTPVRAYLSRKRKQVS